MALGIVSKASTQESFDWDVLNLALVDEARSHGVHRSLSSLLYPFPIHLAPFAVEKVRPGVANQRSRLNKSFGKDLASFQYYDA